MAADRLAALLARGSAALKTGLDSRLADAGATIGIVVGVRSFALDARHIPTASMRPTFLEGDLLLVDKLSVKLRPPRRGEVVLFRAPPMVARALKLKQTWGSDACFIKRVVATAGDEVRVSMAGCSSAAPLPAAARPRRRRWRRRRRRRPADAAARRAVRRRADALPIAADRRARRPPLRVGRQSERLV